MKKSITLILIIFLFKSCYFGMFLVEKQLPGNFSLWAEDNYNQLKITHSLPNTSVYNLIIKPNVFAVGYNKEFIISKSFSDGKLLYHIINVKKETNQHYLNLTFEQYKFNRKHLNVPYELNFTIVYHEVEKN